MASAEESNAQVVVMPERGVAAAPALSPESLIAMAIEKNTPIDALERLMALRDKIKEESSKEAFFAALSGFQSECPIIPKNKTAKIRSTKGDYSYNYAPLDTIVPLVQPIMHKHGLSFTIEAQLANDPLRQIATCVVHHINGYSKSSTFEAPIDLGARMNCMQQSASAITYAKRYAFLNALGIMTGDEDDDGNVSSSIDNQSSRRASQSTQAQPNATNQSTNQAAAQQTAAPASDGEPWMYGYVEYVSLGDSGKFQNGAPWQAYQLVIDGEKYVTFSSTHYKAAAEALQSNRECRFQWKPGKQNSKKINEFQVNQG